jgi:hypothetical protein
LRCFSFASRLFAIRSADRSLRAASTPVSPVPSGTLAALSPLVVLTFPNHLSHLGQYQQYLFELSFSQPYHLGDGAKATGLRRNTITNIEVNRYVGDPESLALIERVLRAAGIEFHRRGRRGPRSASP